MDGGAWWATVHGVAELDMTERLHFASLLFQSCRWPPSPCVLTWCIEEARFLLLLGVPPSRLHLNLITSPKHSILIPSYYRLRCWHMKLRHTHISSPQYVLSFEQKRPNHFINMHPYMSDINMWIVIYVKIIICIYAQTYLYIKWTWNWFWN